jgi:hypothetical protein
MDSPLAQGFLSWPSCTHSSILLSYRPVKIDWVTLVMLFCYKTYSFWSMGHNLDQMRIVYTF